MSINLGKTTKNSKYLNTIKTAILNIENHPKKHKIKMQAHHIISADGMKKSGLAHKIAEFGYDINNLRNLAFIPCTLQGACYLGIQPHRGNHDVAIDEENYTDDMEPFTYHELVADMVKSLKPLISRECAGNRLHVADSVEKALERLSENLLSSIQNQPHVAPLTKIASSFKKGGVGCSGVDSVMLHNKLRPCPVDHGHLYDSKNPSKSQGAKQKIEEISFSLESKYKLYPGR
jgi:hypothetical protein